MREVELACRRQGRLREVEGVEEVEGGLEKF
jgi:hypothetical protein